MNIYKYNELPTKFRGEFFKLNFKNFSEMCIVFLVANLNGFSNIFPFSIGHTFLVCNCYPVKDMPCVPRHFKIINWQLRYNLYFPATTEKDIIFFCSLLL